MYESGFTELNNLQNMTKNDRIKLEKAGFTLLRVHDHSVDGLKMTCIRPGEGNWRTMETFTTKAALSRRIKEIDANEPKMIFE